MSSLTSARALCRHRLEEAREALKATRLELDRKVGQIHELENKLVELDFERRREVAYERNMRVSAQRGLVAYMKEHGLEDRIGYDPDEDAIVQREIAAGQLPPRNDPEVIASIARTIIAEKSAR